MLTLNAGRLLLCLLFICSLPGWLLGETEEQTDNSSPIRVVRQGQGQGQAEIDPPFFTDGPAQADAATVGTSGCREEKYPCTRVYSVHKPMKQCILYLCITNMRRVYVINKEVCSRLVCKETEAAEDDICRQLSGLPPRRFSRSNGRPCKRAAGELQGHRIG
ncbi:microfibrillar-associated protein 5 isoform X2 [Microcaecilia unicolor]|uniref:Microfibrillar-associated protein 5 isoform X2 n=1 Tax=Microcaecilia unicolor TaxID=1415580 RepID=A0A6P7WRU8_9AMPH|nr:microfibrillar-associated protein 5 isoform X2 [Microcaecilia unicolor]